MSQIFKRRNVNVDLLSYDGDDNNSMATHPDSPFSFEQSAMGPTPVLPSVDVRRQHSYRHNVIKQNFEVRGDFKLILWNYSRSNLKIC